ncbi:MULTISPECIES: hypothetical protein [unclassified Bacteroides]|uniref:hypothetical protein n=1 Tax=unclassified Bacteroides TaxID=2646097 RepID=UPI0004E1A196|nr:MULTISPECIES: hypothetical protein [unclassified Bacteroides]
MFWLITIAIIIIVAYKLGATSGQVIERVNNSGGMRVKYAKLIDAFLGGHDDCQIFVETRTYIRFGVSNYGGTTLFHIQQSTDNKVIIQYEVKNNPICAPFQLQWFFPDDMNQDEMVVVMLDDMEKKMKQIMRM